MDQFFDSVNLIPVAIAIVAVYCITAAYPALRVRRNAVWLRKLTRTAALATAGGFAVTALIPASRRSGVVGASAIGAAVLADISLLGLAAYMRVLAGRIPSSSLCTQLTIVMWGYAVGAATSHIGSIIIWALSPVGAVTFASSRLGGAIAFVVVFLALGVGLGCLCWLAVLVGFLYRAFNRAIAQQ